MIFTRKKDLSLVAENTITVIQEDLSFPFLDDSTTFNLQRQVGSFRVLSRRKEGKIWFWWFPRQFEGCSNNETHRKNSRVWSVDQWRLPKALRRFVKVLVKMSNVPHGLKQIGPKILAQAQLHWAKIFKSSAKRVNLGEGESWFISYYIF